MHLTSNAPRLLLLGAVLLAAACSQQKSSSLTVSSRGTAPASAVAPSLGAVAVGGGFTVDRVRVAVREVELSGATCESPGTTTPAPAGSGMVLASHDDGGGDDHGGGSGHDGDDDHGGCEVEVGPFLVDLAGSQLGGAVNHAFDADVPAGTYRKLEIKVCPVSSTVAGFSELNGASVVIDGSAPPAAAAGDARPFHLELGLCAELERETSLTVGATSSNVTLTIDPMAWFTGPGGRVLDPASAADRDIISANVRASIDAFDDDDRDGDDDHGGGGHGADDGAGHH